MIDVKDLRKRFGEQEVLKGITTRIRLGDKISIIGPSGSGKSTFLRCLNRLDEPTSGSIRINGQEILDPKCNINVVRAHMGMVFQHFNLFPHLSVRQNITMAPLLLKVLTPDAANAKAEELLKRVGLSDKIDQYPN